MALPSLEDYFPDWKAREELAEKMIPIIGKLYRKNVVTYCYGRALYNQSVTRLMKTYRYVRQVAQNELSESVIDQLSEQVCALHGVEKPTNMRERRDLVSRWHAQQAKLRNGSLVPRPR